MEGTRTTMDSFGPVLEKAFGMKMGRIGLGAVKRMSMG